MDKTSELIEWFESMDELHLPRWKELPDIDLYMDQVLTLIERYLNPLFPTNSETILTKSMVNNYVKLKLIPPPIKKQYTKKHVAYLIAISMLKQVLSINEIRIGILHLISIYGEKKVYNYFIEEQELAIKTSVMCVKNDDNYELILNTKDEGMLTMKFAIISLSTKIITEKIIETLSME